MTAFGKKDTVKIEKQDYKYILLIGAMGYFVAVGAQLPGTKYAGASMASLINSLNPVTMTLFGAQMSVFPEYAFRCFPCCYGLSCLL